MNHSASTVQTSGKTLCSTEVKGDNLSLALDGGSQGGPNMVSDKSPIRDQRGILPEEHYEGRVVLNVQYEGNISLLLEYIQTIRDSPHFHFFRFLTDPGRGVYIWLGLREPLPLPQLLMEMGNVAEVIPGQGNGKAHDDDGPVITVVLVDQREFVRIRNPLAVSQGLLAP